MEPQIEAKKRKGKKPGPAGSLTQVRIARNKKRVLQALKEYQGFVSKACEEAGIGRTTFYHWVEDDPEFASAVKEIEEDRLDFVEDKAVERIKGIKDAKGNYVVPPSDTMIIFYLKTKGKGRGYIERMEVTDPGKNNPYENMSLNELIKEREKRLNEKS